MRKISSHLRFSTSLCVHVHLHVYTYIVLRFCKLVFYVLNAFGLWRKVFFPSNIPLFFLQKYLRKKIKMENLCRKFYAEKCEFRLPRFIRCIKLLSTLLLWRKKSQCISSRNLFSSEWWESERKLQGNVFLVADLFSVVVLRWFRQDYAKYNAEGLHVIWWSVREKAAGWNCIPVSIYCNRLVLYFSSEIPCVRK